MYKTAFTLVEVMETAEHNTLDLQATVSEQVSSIGVQAMQDNPLQEPMTPCYHCAVKHQPTVC